MGAIYKRELNSYYKGFIGYIFAVPLLVMAGIYAWVYHFVNGYSDFVSYTLKSLTFVLIFLVPVLTMRTLSEEKRQRTDQLLYSLPTTMTRVVIGKYLAMLTVFALPLCIVGIYPLILTAFGTVSLGAAYAGLFAFFLLGAALIAIGQFISSLTENQAVALVLCLLVMLLDYFLTAIAGVVSSTASASLTALIVLSLVFGLIVWLLTKNPYIAGVVSVILIAALLVLYGVNSALFEGLFAKVMKAMCVFTRFDSFASGLFDLTAVIYYLAVIFMFQFLTVQSMEKRRWN